MPRPGKKAAKKKTGKKPVKKKGRQQEPGIPAGLLQKYRAMAPERRIAEYRKLAGKKEALNREILETNPPWGQRSGGKSLQGKRSELIEELAVVRQNIAALAEVDPRIRQAEDEVLRNLLGNFYLKAHQQGLLKD